MSVDKNKALQQGIQELLKVLRVHFEKEGDYDEELRSDMLALINEVAKDPSAANLRALGVVLKMLGNEVNYLAAVTALSSEETSLGDQLEALRRVVDVISG